jgi:poly(3-hydroxybutyrate) depolymerase
MALPASYDARHPYRLIFAFHGRQYSAESVASGGPPGSGPYYGIQSEANGNAIFVAPQALQSSWSNESGRDLAFVTAMVARLESELCIDTHRIFSTGFSMGAIMTIAIGCSQANVFRAIAPMSGSIQGTCAGSQPIAYWASHGTKDTTIPIANGEAARDVFVTRNGCNETGAVTGTPAGCVNYAGCTDGHPTTWCTFDGVHEPPPFAGQAIWAFFSQF